MNMLLAILLSSAFATSTPSRPPKIYIDKGACPFECCTYGEWSVIRDTDLYSAVDGKTLVATAKAQTKVKGVTGEVHVIPTKVTVLEKHGPYKRGDIIYILTEEGEGHYKIWNNGEISSDGDIYQLFDNGSPKLRAYWGKPDGKPQSTWWVKIQLPDGKVGWTKETKNFGNIDSCG